MTPEQRAAIDAAMARASASTTPTAQPNISAEQQAAIDAATARAGTASAPAPQRKSDFAEEPPAAPGTGLGEQMLERGKRNVGLVSDALGQAGSKVLNFLSPSEAPAVAPATTPMGHIEQGAKQVAYGLESGLLGTAGRAVARAAGEPIQRTAPGTIPEYIGRGLGTVGAIAADVAALPAAGLAGAAKVAEPALAEGVAAAKNLVPTVADWAANIGKGAGLGAAATAGEQYASTGKADAGHAVLGAGLGGLVSAAPMVAETLSRLRPETAAAIRSASPDNRLATAAPLRPFEEGSIATTTNPNMRPELLRATRDVEGQQKLGNVLQTEVDRAQRAAATPTDVVPLRTAANAPLEQEIGKARTEFGVQQAAQQKYEADVLAHRDEIKRLETEYAAKKAAAEQDKIAKSQTAAEEQRVMAEKAAKEAADAGDNISASALEADMEHARLGDKNALMSDLGREIQVASRERKSALEAQRQEAIKPELEALNTTLKANASTPIEVGELLNTMSKLKSGGTALSDMPVSYAGVEEAAAQGRAVPSLTELGKENTLRKFLLPDTETATTGTTYDRLKVVEGELSRAAKKATGQDAIAYQNALKQTRDLLEKHTGGAESAFRAAYEKASQPLNDLTQNGRSFVEDAAQYRDFARRDVPAREGQYAMDSEDIAKVLKGTKAQAGDLINVLGPERAEQVVGHAYASELSDASAKQIASFIHDRRDFLSAFPPDSPLRRNLNNLLSARMTHETAAEAAGVAAKTAGKAQTAAERAAAKIPESKMEPLKLPEAPTPPPKPAKEFRDPKELTKQLFDENPVVAQQQVDRILDRASTDAKPLIEMHDRLKQVLGPAEAKTQIMDAAKRRVEKALARQADELKKGTATLGEARGIVGDLSGAWENIRKGLKESKVLTEADLANGDTVMQGIRTAAKDKVGLNVALSATGKEAEKSGFAAYGASGADVAGQKFKFYAKPLQMIGYDKKVQTFINDAMFDPKVMASLAKKLEAAKTRAARAKVFDSSPVLKSILGAHYAAGLAGGSKPPMDQSYYDYLNSPAEAAP